MTSPKLISSVQINEILRLNLHFSPLYGNRLANHLPMATVALRNLGASPEQVRRFVSDYAQRLDPLPISPKSEPPPVRFPTLGSRDFDNDTFFFASQLEAIGVDAVLKVWIPRLFAGLSASAFHCLIRLAYAVEAGVESEIGAALAFWSSEYVCFSMPLIEHDKSPAEVFDEVVANFSVGKAQSGIIIDKMVAASSDPFFAQGIFVPKSLDMDSIRSAVLALYERCEDFTLLHTVTATHAARVLRPFFLDEAAACRHLWVGLNLAVATVADVLARAQPRNQLRPFDGDWNAIFNVGTSSSDDHVIKLIYTAWQESQLGSRDRYKWVAARKAGLIPG